MTRGASQAHDNSVATVTALSFCMVLVATCLPAHATLIFQYAGNLTLDEGRHGQPRPVAVSIDAASGDALVSDAAGAAVHVLHHAGGARFVTGAISGLSNPADAVAERDGGFLLLDAGGEHGRTIRRLDLRGEPVPFTAEPPANGWRPEHLTLLADGHVLTLDTTRGLLAKHDAADGALIWSRSLWADGGPDKVCGRPAEAPDGRIYIPMSQDHRVLVLTADGRPDGGFGVVGSTPGKFSFPVDVAFGPEDSILVLDRMRSVVLVFDAAHEFVSEYGRMGASPGAFYHPASLAFASGRLYVAQGFEGRVQVFDVFSTEADDRAEPVVSPPLGES